MKIYKIIPVLFLLFVHNAGLWADELFETPEGTPDEYYGKLPNNDKSNPTDNTKCTWDYGTNFTYTADNAQGNNNIATKAYIYDYNNEWKEVEQSNLVAEQKLELEDNNSAPYVTLKPKELKSSSKIYILFVSYVKDDGNLITNPGFENEEWSATNHGYISQYEPVEPGSSGLENGEGKYTIDNTLNRNNNVSDYTCSQDHTSGYGKFFIANGSTDPTKKVWIQAITNSIANKYYAFSAWVMNWADDRYGNPPKLQFYITDGTTNGFETLGGITEVKTGYQCTWQQIFAIKKMSNRRITQLYLINSQSAGAGNDFALDDLYFGEVKKIYQLYTIDIGKYFEPENISIALCPTLLPTDKQNIGGVKEYIAGKLNLDISNLETDATALSDNMEFEYKITDSDCNTKPYTAKKIKVTYTETPDKTWNRTNQQGGNTPTP